MYASSEGVVGVKKMGMKRPTLKSYTVDEFESIFDGSFFSQKADGLEQYVYVKLAATLWISAMARNARRTPSQTYGVSG